MNERPTAAEVRFLIRTVAEVVGIVVAAVVFGLAGAVACGGIS